MTTLSEADLELARTVLRTRQRVDADRAQDGEVTAAALKAFAAQNAFLPHKDPDRVTRGAFSFYRSLELERLARGEALIRRVRPGIFEDPSYFALLAYQAASLEMAWGCLAPAAPPETFSRFLLGTAHHPDVNAMALRVRAGATWVIVVNSGLVDFVHQAAKVIVAAASPQDVDDRRLVKATFGSASALEYLKSDPEPAERLYRTLEAYFFGGYPRAFGHETVPAVMHPPLALLVGFAERWIIGHEYGHGMIPPMIDPPPDAHPDVVKEFFADAMATAATVHSAGWLDGVPPEFPLGSAIFVLACLDVLDRGRRLVTTGDDTAEEADSTTHPTPRDRARETLRGFKRSFDVRYTPDHNFDLEYWVRPEPPTNHGFTADKEEVAYSYANALIAVWTSVRDRLKADHASGRPLHPMWVL